MTSWFKMSRQEPNLRSLRRNELICGPLLPVMMKHTALTQSQVASVGSKRLKRRKTHFICCIAVKSITLHISREITNGCYKRNKRLKQACMTTLHKFARRISSLNQKLNSMMSNALCKILKSTKLVCISNLSLTARILTHRASSP